MVAGRFGAFGASEIDAVSHWRAMLGVPEHASPEEIKHAYRHAVKLVHPDLHPDNATAASLFRSLQDAYQALIAIANQNSISGFIDVSEGQS